MDFAFGAVLACSALLALAGLFWRYPRSWRVGLHASLWRAPFVAIALTFILALSTTWYGRPTAAFLTAAATTAAAIWHVRRARYAHAIERALESLGDAGARASAASELARLVGAAPSGRGYSRWAVVVQHVASRMARAGYHEMALGWAQQLDPTRLSSLAVAARAQVMAASFIALRDRRRAWDVLASVPRPVPSAMWEGALTALGVLLEALQGDAAAAEARARASLDAETEPTVRLTWRMALAHAVAAQGRREEAATELRELHARAPADANVLERLARHGGPASPIAESLLLDVGAAYR